MIFRRSLFRSLCLSLLLMAAAIGVRANQIAVGQFQILVPSSETVGYYGFTITNLTGNSTSGACNPSYPVCTDLLFVNPVLTVNYGYAQIDGSGNIVPGTLTGQSTYTAMPQVSDPFDAAYNGCGVYGVDSGCAGLGDVNNTFQLAVPILDGSGNNLVILGASFTASTIPTNTNLGVLSGPYTASMNPTTDCGGPCNFLDPGLSATDPYTGDWEYYDASVDIVTRISTGTPVPDPATVWLTLVGATWLAWLGWLHRRPAAFAILRK